MNRLVFVRQLQLRLERPLKGSRNSSTSATSQSTGATTSGGSWPIGEVLKSGLTTGSLATMGDLLAQYFQMQATKNQQYDPWRTVRMAGFGFLFYGPYQLWWYALLNRRFPGPTLPNLATKVFLNQTCLGPVVLTTVFAWNLGLTGSLDQFKTKMQYDFVPSLTTGWKFWIPASFINFYLVPLPYQVLYMSACGTVWTAYLSHASATSRAQSSQGDQKLRPAQGQQ